MKENDDKIDLKFLRQLDRFSLMVRKRVSTSYAGSRRSVRSGRGLDTLGYRDYHAGDELRTVDWNVYARTEKLYVRQFEEAKSVTTHILLDSSNSMAYPKGGMTKFHYASMVALGFAYLVTRDNDSFTISTFTDDVEIRRPRRGRRHLLDSIDRLNFAEVGGDTDIDNCIKLYEKAIHSRSLIIIVSDFMQDLEAIESAIYRLSAHDLMLIQVLDKSERELSLHGHSRLTDLETEDELKTYISKSFQKDYNQALEDHLAYIQNICDHVGADFYTVTTDKPIFDTFLYTLGSRRRW
ncbi:uncharacterized protein (DUF58 family) [Methanohalophilus levihalophilus]|uniref:DUF58 domain-containing protein n=1 Tax=Methanohalophilus levihalophilus TaxID=1431282 RepID=UPI001AE5FDD9|nr:DUF58 domain-containing protein [Methanohalophilus levihalophilus]MBP2029595.1 uncharacterized protein (DUF58 family) [Methanohalophilus levihalophilus]